MKFKHVVNILSVIIILLTGTLLLQGCDDEERLKNEIIESNWHGSADEDFFKFIIKMQGNAYFTYFKEDDLLPFNEIIDYFVYTVCYDNDGKLTSYGEKYYSDTDQTFVVPCDETEKYITKRFNTVVDRESVEGYDKNTETYKLKFHAMCSTSTTDILSITELEKGKYRVELMNRVTVESSSILTDYREYIIQVDQGEYKFLAVIKLTDNKKDYSIKDGIYESDDKKIIYPTLISTDGKREKFFKEKNDQIIARLLQRISNDSDVKSLSLNYSITFNDYYFISILFTGQAEYEASDGMKDVLYTLTFGTVSADYGCLFSFYDYKSTGFIDTFKQNMIKQLPPEKVELIKNNSYDYYLSMFEKYHSIEGSIYSENLLKFNLTKNELHIYAELPEQPGQYFKVIIPYEQIEKFKLY